MENRLQPTFIPHRPNTPGDPYARPRSSNSLMLIAVAIFALVLAAYGGLYFYRDQLTVSNDQKKAQIEEVIRNFEPELTKELSSLKARIDAGDKLLKNHKAFSLFLALLEINTAETISFNDLTYTVAEDDISLKLQGVSETYNAIAFQSDIFSRLDPIKSPVFSDLNLNEEGLITFNVEAKLDPSAVSYSKLVEAFLPPPVVEEVVEEAVVESATSSSATTTPES